MAAGSDKKAQELLRLRRALQRAEQTLAEIDRTLLAPSGLCPSDLGILERLARKGARPINGLAGRVGLTSGSMTTAVQRLRRRTLVETRRGLDDKRVVWVSATEQGCRVAERISLRRANLLSDAFEALSARERHVLTALLKRVRKGAQEALEDRALLDPGRFDG